MLSARNRMTRSAEFTQTVKSGVRAAQPDLVVHASRSGTGRAPRVGLIVAKSVGGAVDRHAVSRRLRHAARAVIAELEPADRIVVRALPTSRGVDTARLQQQLTAGVRRAHALLDRPR